MNTTSIIFVPLGINYLLSLLLEACDTGGFAGDSSSGILLHLPAILH